MMQRRVMLAGCAGAMLAPTAFAESLVRTLTQVKPSVVGISTFRPARALSAQLSGTGFIVADGRHVITNEHVTRNEDEKNGQTLSVLIANGAQVDRRAATIVAVDRQHDLALLRIEGPAGPAVRLWRDANLAPEGSDVAITGFPIGAALGLIAATHRGVIAAHAPNIIPMPDTRYLDAQMIRAPRFLVYQLDVVAYPGNSGSPLYLAETGEVIGVVNSTFVKVTREKALTDPSGISFAVPSGFIRQLMIQAGLTP
jgi:serine protease Do